MVLQDLLSCKKDKNKIYYEALMKQCDVNLEKMDQALPPPIEALGESGIEISFTTFNVINQQPGSDQARQLSEPSSD